MNSWWVSVCTLGVKVTVCSGDVMGGSLCGQLVWCGVGVCSVDVMESVYY